jgi:hypothetical protein
LVPHEQLPFLQLSAVRVSHAPHDAPFVPQVGSDGALHVEPEQQPFGHEDTSQTQAPPTQC